MVQQLTNEILLNIRVNSLIYLKKKRIFDVQIKQFQDEDFNNENEIKNLFQERNQLIEKINEITKDFHLTEQIFQQRHFIIQEKVSFFVFLFFIN